MSRAVKNRRKSRDLPAGADAGQAAGAPAARQLYCCCLTEAPGPSGILPEFLAAREWQFSSWTEAEKNITRHTVYAEEEKSRDEIYREIMACIPVWKGYGIRLEKAEKAELAYEDWAEVWKKYYPIIHVPPGIVIKPSWLEYAPKAQEIVLEMDPGMSFGTGQHATTRACLTMLQILAVRKMTGFCLDAGCGSGVLSIAVVKLGLGTVTALDSDPAAVKIAAANFAHNRLGSGDFELHCAGLAEFAASGRRYRLICANILAPVLIQNAPGLLALLEPAGVLILSGILAREYAEVKTTFTRLGFREESVLREEEWQSGLFHAPR